MNLRLIKVNVNVKSIEITIANINVMKLICEF